MQVTLREHNGHIFGHCYNVRMERRPSPVSQALEVLRYLHWTFFFAKSGWMSNNRPCL
jgi:hypothetical protein